MLVGVLPELRQNPGPLASPAVLQQVWAFFVGSSLPALLSPRTHSFHRPGVDFWGLTSAYWPP